ncbi:MAG: hypothetical protein COA52_01185 [Hyphomicrobiales bacterium]|nr:MAG: hypothetical protein COA52_00095 [Hyphomicrobiales bacterium]PCJ96851.1 MAG: hypothetical protein COA52_01185 [Hyphomicrobiales bacterium]
MLIYQNPEYGYIAFNNKYQFDIYVKFNKIVDSFYYDDNPSNEKEMRKYSMLGDNILHTVPKYLIKEINSLLKFYPEGLKNNPEANSLRKKIMAYYYIV